MHSLLTCICKLAKTTLFKVMCSSLWSQIQPTNACQLKYFNCEEKCEWIELYYTSDCKYCQKRLVFTSLQTAHRIDARARALGHRAF